MPLDAVSSERARCPCSGHALSPIVKVGSKAVVDRGSQIDRQLSEVMGPGQQADHGPLDRGPHQHGRFAGAHLPDDRS